MTLREKTTYGVRNNVTTWINNCQALPDEPLHSSFIMSKMALAAYEGGAVGIRANTKEDILAIKETVDLPVIGIVKRDSRHPLRCFHYCNVKRS